MVTTRYILVCLGMLSWLSAGLSAQSGQEPEVGPPRNWPAPLFWHPADAAARARFTAETATVAPAVGPTATLPLGPNALVFVAMTPCRVLDTRTSQAFPSPFGAPRLTGGTARTFPLPSSTKCGIPSTARAYSLNVTVVPPAPLGFLTIYPTGQPRPLASTLNSPQGQVVANAAIVEAGTSGSVDVYASNNTDLVIDINGYYAPPSDGSNTAVGSSALTANAGGFNNTAFGTSALAANTSGFANTATGQTALSRNTFGYHNTAYGTWALRYNIGGNSDTAVGSEALSSNTSGAENVAVGTFALVFNDTGSKNIAIGSSAAYDTSPGASNNIEIGNNGTPADSGIIRIGTPGDQIAFFAAGIRGVTTNLAGGAYVLVDANGQLGTASSSRRFKEDISDMGDASSSLLRLRPVTFRYKKPYADGSKPLDYGLIAEEVADVYPDLVSRSADGQIETVQYHKLAPMLLNELQKQQQHAAEQEERIRSLESRLASLESLLTPKPAPAAQ